MVPRRRFRVVRAGSVLRYADRLTRKTASRLRATSSSLLDMPKREVEDERDCRENFGVSRGGIYPDLERRRESKQAQITERWDKS